MSTTRIPAGQGQESVWDYPRPPKLEDSIKQVLVVFNGVEIANSKRAKRVLETSHPPVYYIPLDDIRQEFLINATSRTYCEFKGAASYFTLKAGDKVVPNAAWYYQDPSPSYAALKNYVAFYPGKMEACFLDGEKVEAQAGDFYGGWITKGIVGPFKGGAGTRVW